MNIKYIIPILCVALLSCESFDDFLMGNPSDYKISYAAMTDEELLKECRTLFYRDIALDEIEKRGLMDDVSLGYIRAEKIYIGMSEKAARCSLGSPENVNTTVSAGGVRHQWVYECYTGNGYSLPCKYVYIRNGKVTSHQSSAP